MSEVFVEDLEKAGLLSFLRIADQYPCDQPGGDECPREIIQQTSEIYRAQCRNRPPECDAIELEEEDVAFLSTEARQFCQTMAKVLHVRPAKSPDTQIHCCFRVGTFIPEPGEKYPVYFVTRPRASDYGEVLEALRSQNEWKPIAVLVPTDEVIGDDVIRQMQARCITVLSLSDILSFRDGCLVPAKDPRELFALLGNHEPLLQGRICAVAYLRQKGGSQKKKRLTEEEYEELIADADRYDFFADQRTGKIAKPGAVKQTSGVRRPPDTAFRMTKLAIESQGHFDPFTGEFRDRSDPAQTFRRARAFFDLKGNDGQWALFQTVQDHSPTLYRFDPRPDVSYAFVFFQGT